MYLYFYIGRCKGRCEYDKVMCVAIEDVNSGRWCLCVCCYSFCSKYMDD